MADGDIAEKMLTVQQEIRMKQMELSHAEYERDLQWKDRQMLRLLLFAGMIVLAAAGLIALALYKNEKDFAHTLLVGLGMVATYLMGRRFGFKEKATRQLEKLSDTSREKP